MKCVSDMVLYAAGFGGHCAEGCRIINTLNKKVGENSESSLDMQSIVHPIKGPSE